MPCAECEKLTKEKEGLREAIFQIRGRARLYPNKTEKILQIAERSLWPERFK